MSNGYDVHMCWKCGKTLDISPPISRSEQCPSCGADVRSCRNCTFYDVGAPYDCREHIEEPVTDKERACFCTWFSLNPSASGTSFSAYTGALFSAKSAANSVRPAALQAEQAKNAFNALFGDNA